MPSGVPSPASPSATGRRPRGTVSASWRAACRSPDPPPNLTLMHDRAAPLGRPVFTDGPDALRFEAPICAGVGPLGPGPEFQEREQRPVVDRDGIGDRHQLGHRRRRRIGEDHHLRRTWRSGACGHRRRAPGGASLGFRAAYGGERRSADGIREISRARLLDIALVDRPSYRGSSIEVRSEWPALPAFWWR